MSRQIIRIPDDTNSTYKWALWSSGVDDFVAFFVDDEELIRYHCARAYEEERKAVIEIMGQLAAGEKPYLQFTLSWGEANRRAYEAHPENYEALRKEDLDYDRLEEELLR